MASPPTSARSLAPVTLVIFGASGDLTKRKLVPSLYSLTDEGLLPSGFSVVGVARTKKSDDDFRSEMREGCENHARKRPIKTSTWDEFARGIFYHPGDPSDPKIYATLSKRLEEIDRDRGGVGNRIFYLALPPRFFPHALRGLGESRLLEEGDKTYVRVIIEKPFGRDLSSARVLNQTVNEVIRESQVYRIDHYLGKETVQNILVFRLANGMFEPIWNHRHIEHVQITVAESIGIGTRGAYFDDAGILRDMVQNHLLQLLSLMAMEPPAAFEAASVRDEKVKVLRALRTIRGEEVPDHAVRGQYGPGAIAGKSVSGYREESKVRPDSPTETYVALKIFLDNWRWSGVPFYLRTGKRLPKKVTEIAIHFRRAPHLLFKGVSSVGTTSNVLAIRIQPNEGISLKFDTKVPGPDILVQSVNMEFHYGASFGDAPPEAYENLLLDAIEGDGTLFTRRDEIETAWAWTTDVMAAWAEAPPPDFPNYEAGAWGPEEADRMIRADGREWRTP